MPVRGASGSGNQQHKPIPVIVSDHKGWLARLRVTLLKLTLLKLTINKLKRDGADDYEIKFPRARSPVIDIND
jgi:hypothetical protein